jgi:hypothetical protein
MKRAAILLAAVLLLFPLPASADRPGVWAEANQTAEADWIVLRTPTRGVFYFAFGARLVDSFGAVGTYGVVGRGKCNVERGRHFTVTMCYGSGRMKEIPIEDFEFDPAMASARLTVRLQGFDHDIEWTGRGDPGAGWYFGGGGTSVFGGAGIGRNARASGEVFGEHLESGRHSFAGLGYGAFGGVFAAGDRSVEITDDGRVVVHATYRLPRN